MGNLDDLFDQIFSGEGQEKKEDKKEQQKQEEKKVEQKQEQIQQEQPRTQQSGLGQLLEAEAPPKEEEKKEKEQKQVIQDPKPIQQTAQTTQVIKQEGTIVKQSTSTLRSILGEDALEGDSEDEFVFEAEPPSPKEVWLIAGEKNDGKTAAAFSFINREGTNQLVCIAFDTKSASTWWKMYNGDSRIIVFSGKKYYSYTEKSEITAAAARTFKYIITILDKLRDGIDVKVGDKVVRVERPDWIVIDNTEVFMRICEFTARYYWKIPPFTGAEWKLWDERNHYISEFFYKCLDVAKKGVIYTTYVRTEDLQVEGGQIIRRKEVPKWVEAIKYETDFVVRVWKDPTSRRFFAEIIGSKDDNLVPTGAIYDITDIGLWEAIKQKRLRT